MPSAQSILDKIKQVDQSEVFLSNSKSLSIDVLDGKVESVDEIRDIGIGIRVIKDQKLGFAFTSDLDEYVVDETIRRAIENAKNAEADEFNVLPKNAKTEELMNLRTYDQKIDQVPIKEKIERTLNIEKSAYQVDKKIKKTEKVSYSETENEVWIVNSNGLNVNYKKNHCGAFAEVIAEQNGEMETGFDINYVARFDDLDFEAIGKEAAKQATQLLGAKNITSQKLPLVIVPQVAAQLLEILVGPLSAEAVQKGKSLFAGRLDQMVASEIMTLIDNGRLDKGIGSAPFDSEGVPTQETKLVEKGRLKNLFFNTYTAHKGKSKSTGNAARGSFQTLPGIGPTNLYIQAGSQTEDEILRDISKGLYVVLIMGAHTANPISGDFSFGAAGIMIENGKLTYPVRGITIAGNLIDLLKHLRAVGSNLRFMANIGAPTLLFEGITVSG